MIRAERQRRILELGKEREVITLEELAAALSVSLATVRRDTEELYKQGFLQRTRGGIVFNRANGNPEPSLKMRTFLNMEEKKRIAQAAIRYVSNHSCYMLDSGSTVHELVKRISPKLEVSLITYDLSFLPDLAVLEGANVFFTGGQLRREHLSCHGVFAAEMLEWLSADTVFLGADAVDLKKGIMGFNTNDIVMKQKMIANAKHSVLLCDHSKFENRGIFAIQPLNGIERVITGTETPAEIIKQLTEMGIEVECV